ncbi:MAG: ABC transporter ATP-binding protein [Thermaerobacter sp.]|nr:ABC transporter ATP-binding protein [Thermaerobacter sp.]MDA8145828.1 ABC transporter ATP-binding protein [Thermaerobacter sp.]
MFRISLEQPRARFTVRVDLEVAPGELFCLFGPSGAGKSTVLRTAAGIERLHRGRVVLDDAVLAVSDRQRRCFLPVWRRRLGYLEQHPRLFPHLTVEGNIAYGLPGGQLTKEGRRLARELGLEEFLGVYPHALSGGQRQRVALARALAADPRALLLDEPFSALDEAARGELQELLRRVQRRHRLTALFVTHHLAEAQRLADRMGILDEGRLLQSAPPAEIMARPATPRVARLVGYTDFLPGGVFGRSGGLLGVHPDRALLGSFPHLGPVAEGVVEQRTPREGTFRVRLRLPGGHRVSVASPLPDGHGLTPGEAAWITLLDPPVFPVPESAARAAGL